MLPLLVRKRFQDLFHSPLRGSFHLSLTVLVRYRSVRSILALDDGSTRLHPEFSRVPAYFFSLPSSLMSFRVRDFKPLRSTFPDSFHLTINKSRQALPSCSRYFENLF